jgi:DNA-directed RNA polymerase specialized sigma24 family protein
MATGDEGSVTRWLAELKAGDSAAAQRLWARYFADLVRLARARLRMAPRAAEEEEDVALSAFCAAAARGRFPRLDDRDDPWRVLVTLTERKASDLLRRQRRLKRGGGRVAPEADVAGPEGDLLDYLAGTAPTPEFAALVAEEYRRRLAALPEAASRRVAVLKMEGHSNEEIAGRLGLGVRSVVRQLDLIRRTWLGRGPLMSRRVGRPRGPLAPDRAARLGGPCDRAEAAWRRGERSDDQERIGREP